jgi:hypothetical protein
MGSSVAPVSPVVTRLSASWPPPLRLDREARFRARDWSGWPVTVPSRSTI